MRLPGCPSGTPRRGAYTAKVDLFRVSDVREIDLDLVQLGFERALEGDRPTMEQVVERVRLLHKHGLTVARAVAAGESPPRRLHPGVRDRVLKLLRDAGILEHEARGRWRVIDPLLRHYLASLDPFG